MKVFTSNSTKKYEEDFIFAIGGGAVIDEAKIYAKEKGKHLIAVPTTGAGSTETSHAVVWGETKENVDTDIPSTVLPPFPITLSRESRRNTTFDIIGHVVDYLNVCTDNELIALGVHAGKLIEKHPTNLTHPASYELTLKEGVPHGEAVRRVLKDCLDKL